MDIIRHTNNSMDYILTVFFTYWAVLKWEICPEEVTKNRYFPCRTKVQRLSMSLRPGVIQLRYC